jgi:hypothetical protein
VIQNVSNSGIFNFSDAGNQTALSIDFKYLNGSGSCAVDFIAGAPNQLGFVGNAPQNISPYRWVISQEGLDSFNAELKFDLSQLPMGISNPSSVKIFNRSSVGLGLFTELPTKYDEINNTLSVSVNSFSEFILGSDEPLTNIVKQDQTSNKYTLYQNYPNPFNPKTTINYSIPKTNFVTLKIYDVLGREIATLVNEERLPGNYNVKFDGSNIPSGVYFYRLQAGNFSQTKKLILMK